MCFDSSPPAQNLLFIIGILEKATGFVVVSVPCCIAPSVCQPRRFSMEALGSFKYRVTLSTRKSSDPPSPRALTALAGLNRSEESAFPCPSTDCSGGSLVPHAHEAAVGLLSVHLKCWAVISLSLAQGFYHERMLAFVQGHSPFSK